MPHGGTSLGTNRHAPSYDQKLTGRQKVLDQHVCRSSTSVAAIAPVSFPYDGDESDLSIQA